MTMFSMAGTSPDRTLSLIYADGNTHTIPESHDRFSELLELVLSGAEDEEVSDLVDVMFAITKRITQISERVSIRGRQVLFDGDPIHGELSEVLVELFEAGNPESMRPVVNFLEKASTNPSGKSVNDLYRWITKGDLIIHEDGDFLAYKGVRTDDDGNHTSIHEGTAFVDGEEITGYIPNRIGAVVTMPRSDVDMDERIACSTGLHAGTAEYAFDFAAYNGATLLVKINPRDVVSVPVDSRDQKLRVCRYVVQETTSERRTSRVYVQELLPVTNEEIEYWEEQDEEEENSIPYAQPFMDAVRDMSPPSWSNTSDEDEDEDEDEEPDFDPFEDDEDEEEAVFIGGPEEFVQHLSSNEVLEALRQKLSSEDMEYQYSGPTEAEQDVEEANTVIRDDKGRFTKESALNAVRNSKGQFTKRS